MSACGAGASNQLALQVSVRAQCLPEKVERAAGGS